MGHKPYARHIHATQGHFFHPVLTVALCGPHLVWRNWGMAGIQACAWMEWHPEVWSPDTLTSGRASGCPLRSRGVHAWLKINWSRGVNTEIRWVCLGVLYCLTSWDRVSGYLPSYSGTHWATQVSLRPWGPSSSALPITCYDYRHEPPGPARLGDFFKWTLLVTPVSTFWWVDFEILDLGYVVW